MGLKKRQLIPGAEPTIQALPEANYSEVKNGPIQSANDKVSEVAGRTEKSSSSKIRGQQSKYKIDLQETFRKLNNYSFISSPKTPFS